MFALDAIVLIISGFILLRIAGKKVISEMTPLEMVTTLAIGTIIGHVDAHSRLLRTIVTIGLFIIILIVFQYIAMKWPFFQKMIIGKPTLVIKDGQILQQNLAKLRMTTEQLELRVRQQGITNISDIKTATLEVNGQLGYELTKSASPITHKEWEQLLKALKVELEKEEPKKDSVFEKVRRNAE
ncbi:DUF421 domain-containing protein [Paenibacillus terreus]|uniref:DUF421 domain-containing protein n=1 Tax=Paenibacillus terreus TaxID=1387834 RepID=UPI0035CD07F5